jgi:predicted oxidoreductase
MCWNPLGNYFNNASEKPTSLVKKLARKYEVEEAEILLAWLLKLPIEVQPIIGTTTIQRMKNASKATSFSLTPQEWFLLWEDARGRQVD